MIEQTCENCLSSALRLSENGYFYACVIGKFTECQCAGTKSYFEALPHTEQEAPHE